LNSKKYTDIKIFNEIVLNTKTSPNMSHMINNSLILVSPGKL